MGEWIKGRRNALIDAVLFYAVAEWVMPAVVSTVLYLGSSDGGIAVLLMIGYLLLLGTGVIYAITQEGSATGQEEEEGEYRYVYVWSPPPMPFMLGSRGRMIRVRVNPVTD